MHIKIFWTAHSKQNLFLFLHISLYKYLCFRLRTSCKNTRKRKRLRISTGGAGFHCHLAEEISKTCLKTRTCSCSKTCRFQWKKTSTVSYFELFDCFVVYLNIVHDKSIPKDRNSLKKLKSHRQKIYIQIESLCSSN